MGVSLVVEAVATIVHLHHLVGVDSLLWVVAAGSLLLLLVEVDSLLLLLAEVDSLLLLVVEVDSLLESHLLLLVDIVHLLHPRGTDGSFDKK